MADTNYRYCALLQRYTSLLTESAGANPTISEAKWACRRSHGAHWSRRRAVLALVSATHRRHEGDTYGRCGCPPEWSLTIPLHTTQLNSGLV